MPQSSPRNSSTRIAHPHSIILFPRDNNQKVETPLSSCFYGLHPSPQIGHLSTQLLFSAPHSLHTHISFAVPE
ncbi:hypothetical protein COCCADRAFT_83247 [Bipolaris zeicola 26-R-13]|uniref:Uncharacterized protein n=1 Tax=Cochliobolus carbonum (strain 26-R-13) TaxID=930089 RepID=W6Z3Y2_COCC2|nr:uncharacterized protein COCCADRAFT_83247 [Bipolaris zeicola 26-R-13]EUC38391.1 hypothetical protein COCCADRAFT_83247 [Bipolaris zeicola 26-R-13]